MTPHRKRRKLPLAVYFVLWAAPIFALGVLIGQPEVSALAGYVLGSLAVLVRFC